MNKKVKRPAEEILCNKENHWIAAGTNYSAWKTLKSGFLLNQEVLKTV